MKENQEAEQASRVPAGCFSCRWEERDMWRVAVQGFCLSCRDCFMHSEAGEGGSGKVASSSSIHTPRHVLSFYFSLAWRMIRVGRSTSICHKGPFGAVSKSLLSLEQNHWTVWISHACHWLLARWPFLKRWFSMRRQSSTEIRPHNTTSIRTAEVTVERGRPNNTVQLVH